MNTSRSLSVPLLLAPAALLALSIMACSGGASSASGAGGSGDGGTGGLAGSGGSGGACVLPTGRIELSLIEDGECAGEASGLTIVDGTFQPVPGGFQVSNPTDTVEILQVEPAIPAGTFVRLTYNCDPGWYGSASAYVRLENLPTLDGAANSTEDGGRLWYFVAAGGEAWGLALPFEDDTAVECKLEAGSRSISRLSLILTGETFSVTIPAGEEASFEEMSGVHAGKYKGESVYTALIVDPGHFTKTLNVRITRAD